MRELTDDQKLEGLPVILLGNAFDHYEENAHT